MLVIIAVRHNSLASHTLNVGLVTHKAFGTDSHHPPALVGVHHVALHSMREHGVIATLY
jgi:hypothetical protein